MAMSFRLLVRSSLKSHTLEIPRRAIASKQIEQLGWLWQQTTVRSDLPFRKTESPLVYTLPPARLREELEERERRAFI
jgi:hypothetical protein